MFKYLPMGLGSVGRVHVPAGRRHNERLIAALNAEREDPQYRSRAGRLDKWRELYASAQKELQLPDAPPDRLVYLNSKTCRHSKHFKTMFIFVDVIE